MADAEIRVLTDDELPGALRVVAEAMLGSTSAEVLDGWGAMWQPRECHGAVDPDGAVLGIVRWFADEVKVPGGSLPAAGVTAVAVRSTHRRRGLLSGLMAAQLADIHEAGVPIALLVAAEWPIYGRFGYGPAMDACAFEIDARASRFLAPATGRIDLVTPAELHPELERVHDVRWARTPGSLRRKQALVWERMAGLQLWPGSTSDVGRRRAALWRDDAGTVRGAVAYNVTEGWQHNRPNGTAEVDMLVGETVEAERELWRHVCELDWVTTVRAPLRAVDDPLPFLLHDGRAAVQVERSDAIWARLLDLPAAFAARRAPVPGRVVVEVDDAQAYVAGRWAIELGPDAGSASATDEPADVALSAGTLGALYFGGHTARRLAEAGLVTELVEGAVDRLSTLLAPPTAPWSTTHY
jgi:predicted acetyltransferase